MKDFFISHECEVKKLIKRDSYDDGYSQGINQNRHDIAKKLLLSNSNLDFIIQITELSESEIENIAQNININR